MIRSVIRFSCILGCLALHIGCAVEPTDVPLRSEALLPAGGSVFFVGNSFFGWEGRNLPEWVAALGRAEGVSFEVGGDIIPGTLPLSDFLRHPVVADALASRKYQVWIIQGHEYEPIDDSEEFRRSVREFNAAVTASGGRLVLFMTWEFRWRRFMSKLAQAYDSLGRELGVPVVPAGLAYRDCEREPPSGYGPFFLTASPEEPRGGIHENKYGTALNAYAVYAVLTGRNPFGRAFSAPGNDIEPLMLRYLSDRAWARAASRLSSIDE